MEALNRAIEDADAFQKLLEKMEPACVNATPPPRDISREVDEWNERVDREKFAKARNKQIRRSLKERLEAGDGDGR